MFVYTEKRKKIPQLKKGKKNERRTNGKTVKFTIIKRIRNSLTKRERKILGKTYG